MRRAFSAIAELEKRINLAKKARKEVIDYISNLEHKRKHSLISYEKYHEELRKKLDGRTLFSWTDYYDSYIKECEFLIKKKKLERKKKNSSFVFLFLFSLFLVFSLFYFQPSFVGFSVQENVQDYSKTLNLSFEKSGEYEFVIGENGTLDYFLASGYFENSGRVKIYLEDYLIFDSENYEYENLSLEENKSGALLSEQSPSHDRGLLNSSRIYFEKICEETCDLSSENLNKSRYVLRIEVENSYLFLEKVNYGILPFKISEEDLILEESLKTVNEIKLNEPVIWEKRILLNIL
jgi:hypothetical protein